MKTLLFFYLNSLGIVLVLSQSRQPYFAPFTTVKPQTSTSRQTSPTKTPISANSEKSTSNISCLLTKSGHEYAGTLNITQSGRTCQPWASDTPHDHRFKKSTLFPEGSAEAAGNKCRNPDINNTDGVWCYTNDTDKRWEECDVPLCGCTLTEAGHGYAGPLNITQSGRICQRWDSNEPHKHRFKKSSLFPEGSVEDAGNKCRNPDSSNTGGVWCYTNDTGKRWEKCDVPLCVSPTGPQTSDKKECIIIVVAVIVLAGVICFGVTVFIFARNRRIQVNSRTTVNRRSRPSEGSYEQTAPREDCGYEDLVIGNDQQLQVARVIEDPRADYYTSIQDF